MRLMVIRILNTMVPEMRAASKAARARAKAAGAKAVPKTQIKNSSFFLKPKTP